MEKQSFNLKADLLGGYSTMFIKLIIAVILIYALVIILNFLRDKFINKEPSDRSLEMLDLLAILNKLCFVSGFGFVLANILQVLFDKIGDSRMQLPIKGDWDYLVFGIILIFVGIGFKQAKKAVLKNHQV